MTTWTRRCHACDSSYEEPLPADAQQVYDACLVLDAQGAKITRDTIGMIVTTYSNFGGDGWLDSLAALGLLKRLRVKPTEWELVR